GLRDGVRRGRGLRGCRGRPRLPDPPVPAVDRALPLGGLVQHRDHRRDGQPARSVHRRPPRVGGRVARRRLSQAVAQGADELLAARRDPPGAPGRPLREAHAVKWAVVAALAVLLALAAGPRSYTPTLLTPVFFYQFLC